MFPEKLVDMISRHPNIITWKKQCLIIQEEARLTNEILPMYTKCASFQSFIRQLNNYGFTRQPKKHLLQTDIVYVHPTVVNVEDITTLIRRISNKSDNKPPLKKPKTQQNIEINHNYALRENASKRSKFAR